MNPQKSATEYALLRRSESRCLSRPQEASVRLRSSWITSDCRCKLSDRRRSLMIDENASRQNAGFNFYGPQYSRFDSPIAAEMRVEVYGEDIGQQGWRTSAEQSEIADL